MKGWGAAVLCAGLVLGACTSRLEMIPVAADGGRPAKTAVPTVAPTPVPRAEAVARSNPARAFPYPVDVEVAPTPVNHDATREGASVSYIVIHYTVISYERTLVAFRNPNSEVSAHYVVRGDGHTIQMVSPDDVAWHSGNAWFNDHSVGIELELNEHTNPAFTASQYEAAALITCEMVKRYGIPVDRAHLVGHNEVPGSTHSDPGPTWSWPHFMYLVSLCAPANALTVKADFVSQTPYPKIRTNRTGTVSVVLKNTGETTWRRGSSTEARLAIKGNSDDFAFLAKGWIAPDRPAAQEEDVVAPGGTATFRFEVRGLAPGRYVLPLQGVVDGGAWMNDLGLYTVVTVH